MGAFIRIGNPDMYVRHLYGYVAMHVAITPPSTDGPHTHIDGIVFLVKLRAPIPVLAKTPTGSQHRDSDQIDQLALFLPTQCMCELDNQQPGAAE